MSSSKAVFIEICGLDLSILESRHHAAYSEKHLKVFQNFILKNQTFRTFEENYKVTENNLSKHLDLSELLDQLGFPDLEGKYTLKGLQVLPLIEKKIRWKLVSEYQKFVLDPSMNHAKTRSSSLSGVRNDHTVNYSTYINSNDSFKPYVLVLPLTYRFILTEIEKPKPAPYLPFALHRRRSKSAPHPPSAVVRHPPSAVPNRPPLLL
jgi:hypothetical protein